MKAIKVAVIALIGTPVSSFLNGYYSKFVFGGKVSPGGLFGILEEVASGDFDLSSKAKAGMNLEKSYDVFLAELVFSPNDPRVDIVENADRAFDEGFQTWLKKKVASAKDVEEKIALGDLLKMISEMEQKIEISRLAEERKQMEVESVEVEEARTEILTETEVLKKANQVTTLESPEEEEVTPKNFYEAEVTPEIKMSYESLISNLFDHKSPQDLKQKVSNLYDQFDAQLFKVLNERNDDESKVVLEAIAIEQQNRVAIATETLKEVLSRGDPALMEGAIFKFSKEGKIDEPFLLLLEANENQARTSGATGAADLMKRLRNRALQEKDRTSSNKEVRLVRQLLRADNSEERMTLLEDAFTPKESLIVPGTMENARKAVDGEAPEDAKPEPDVSPPDFIQACKALTLNFGNLGSDDKNIEARIKEIASEAEIVATRLFGKGMTPKEQQDRAWKDETTSIFDLERIEIETESQGGKTPWHNPNEDILPGFDQDGRMKVGGG